MSDLTITVEAMQDIKNKVYSDDKKNLPLASLDQLVLIGAVASNKEEEIVFENSSSAPEALRKLNALKLFRPRRDDDDCGRDEMRVEFTKLKMGSLDSKKEVERGFDSKSASDGKKTRACESKKPENKGIKKMKYSQPLAIATGHQDLPEEFKRKIETMGGRSDEARLVIEKELYCSDLAVGANRLSMPANQLLFPFLDEYEVKWLEMPGVEYDITVIDPMVEEERMCLTRWKYRPTNFSYVLRTRWKYVADKNGLQPKDRIQVWSFRNKIDNRLHLAIVKRGEDSNGAGSSSSSSNSSSTSSNSSGSNASTIVEGECSYNNVMVL